MRERNKTILVPAVCTIAVVLGRHYTQSLTPERVGKHLSGGANHLIKAAERASVRKVNDLLQSTWQAAISLMSRVRGYLTGYRQVGKNSRTEVGVGKK